jgi:hypothetical protein
VDCRRALALLTVLITVVVVGAGVHRASPARAAFDGAGAGSRPIFTPAQAAALRTESLARAREAREAARLAEARRLRRSGTVKGALRRAWLARAISRERYEELRRTWWLAQRDVHRLHGTRRAELGAVVAMAERLAGARLLTAARLDPVFLTIRRNREFWTTRALPAPRTRLSFRGDPVVFEYYAGRGLAIQPLATVAKTTARSAASVRPGAR